MYLKYLEIQGFKSFPDRVRLNFDKGVTAVVGPNGSGKSNIGDSVRWVLGEQSTKNLRGNKMEDVIFSGTVGRKPMGFAEVTLTIDNSEGRLEGYGDEVSITRKLYRSGDSEYRINGKAVRLKDINELFMDTGLGRDGYSIIGQGRIAEIVGAKSNERREIFEEAAGISKFRYRKTEAERKLAQAQENMERLNDIVSELESRLAPLKSQSEKAQKFLVLAEEQKTLEISVWTEQLSSIAERLNGLNDKLLVAKTEYENTEHDIEAEEAKIQECYAVMQECSVQAEEARAEIRRLREISAQAKADIAVWNNDIVHHQEALKLLQERHEQELQEQENLNAQLQKAEEKSAEMCRICQETETELSNAQKAFEEMENAYRAEDEKSQKADEHLHQLYLERSELQFQVKSAEEKKQQTETDITNLENSFQENAELLQSAQKEYETALQSMQDIQEKLTAQERKVNECRQSLHMAQQLKQQAEDQLKQCSFQLRDTKQRHRILSDLERNMEGFSGSVKQIMRTVQKGELHGIFGTVAQLIQVGNQYGIAIETALGASVQNLIVENEESAKMGIRFLRDNRAGRATFLPLTTIRGKRLTEQNLSQCAGFVAIASDLVECDPRYREIAENLLGRIVIAENIDSGTEIAKKYGYRFRIVTMDGQVINAGGSFTGGSVQKTGGMLTRKTELQELQNSIETFALRCQQAEEQALLYASETTEAEKALEEQNNIFQDLQRKFLKAQNEAERQAFPVSQYRKNEQDFEQKMQSLKQLSAQAQEILASVKLAQANKNNEISQAETNMSGAKDRKFQMQQQREQLSEQFGNLKIRLAQAQKDKESAQMLLENARSAVEQAKIKSQQYSSELAEHQKMIAEKTEAVKKQEILLSETEQQTAVSEETAKKATQSHDQQNIKIRELQAGLNEYHTAKEKFSAEVTRLSERVNSLTEESDGIVNKLLEVYEMTRSEAKEFAQPIEDMNIARKRLAELKQKIRALGNVNVGAIEEYQEVSERYEFLSKQMKDVRKSKQELEKLIDELTQEMCRIFSESFAIINQNFKEIFVDLFGGGKAELKLSEPENVLTSGIEINVAPPGKVIKNLISLSGGEQSFVAIAIYFAILRLRPAPFCILDEIDAALDEANVRKYARYLKHFINHTQFVLVTHRRSAMEEANVLYGVTMQENGISRLLKLEHVEDAVTE